MVHTRCVLFFLFGLVIIAGMALFGFMRNSKPATKIPQEFNSQQAIGDVEYQLSLGPRTVGSQAHQKAVEWMVQNLQSAGWKTEIQEGQLDGHPIKNVVAKWGEGTPWVILGAHYDSRLVADHDPNPAYRATPVPGANDGASGVAVLLELAKVIPGRINTTSRFQQAWLVFIDTEDNGNIPGWDWILGSRMFAGSLQQFPDAVVILDMIGDANLNILQEGNSDQQLTEQIWQVADRLGYQKEFIPKKGYSMLDDHTPFLERGIRAVDIIDFDYPFYHTTSDTLDKVSSASLQVVGDVMLEWLAGNNP
jgi:Zn-dependent M28 family amino/carboxypeptidase